MTGPAGESRRRPGRCSWLDRSRASPRSNRFSRSTRRGHPPAPRTAWRIRRRARGAGESPGDASGVRGGWRRTETGYNLTVAIAWPGPFRAHFGGRIGFDLIVNEMLPGRERRAGQLVWSGGDGWVWLQGDRQAAERFGILELVG